VAICADVPEDGTVQIRKLLVGIALGMAVGGPAAAAVRH
jgi:hypothetical protein